MTDHGRGDRKRNAVDLANNFKSRLKRDRVLNIFFVRPPHRFSFHSKKEINKRIPLPYKRITHPTAATPPENLQLRRGRSLSGECNIPSRIFSHFKCVRSTNAIPLNANINPNGQPYTPQGRIPNGALNIRSSISRGNAFFRLLSTPVKTSLNRLGTRAPRSPCGKL